METNFNAQPRRFRKGPRHPRRSARPRPWLICCRCGYHLAQIDVFQGWTTLRVGRSYSDHRSVLVVCPNCLTPRTFQPRRAN